MGTDHEFTEAELSILGASMVVPPTHLSDMDMAETLPLIKSRFSLEGRIKWAEEACKETRRRGWTLPNQGDIAECMDALLSQDKDDHPDANVRALIERFESMQLPEPEEEMPSVATLGQN